MYAVAQVLGAGRVNSIFQALRDVRELPADLIFLNREPSTPAAEGEIMAREIDYVQVADLVADDAEALTYDTGKMSIETNAVPNIKHGFNLTQSKMNELSMLMDLNFEGPLADEFKAWERRKLDMNLLGIRQRMELLLIARACDSLNYSRFGLNVNGSWGMPSDLNITVGTDWSNVNATPVTDIQTAQRIARIRYGINYTRMTMSTQAFQYMISTTEFQNKARLFIPAQVTFGNLQTLNQEQMMMLAKQTLGLEIILYDARYQIQNPDASRTFAPFLPITKVILDTPLNDHNIEVQDWASGIVTESLVQQFVPTGMVGSIPRNSRGPVAYVSAKGDMNPPGLTYWGVARGFPRKKMLQANAVLTVGAFSDTVSFGVPF